MVSESQRPTTGVYLAAIFGGLVVLGVVCVGFVVLVVVLTASNRDVEPGFGNSPPRIVYTPPQPLPPQPPPQVVNPEPVRPPPAAAPVTPPPEPLHLAFSDIDDALKYVQSNKPVEKRAAVGYLERAPVDAAEHDKIMAAARVLLNEEAFRTSAMNMLQAWATKADAPALRDLLANMVQTNLASNNAVGGANLVKSVIELLVKFGDKESAGMFAQCLKTEALRPSASAALVSLGAEGESAVLPLAADQDKGTAVEAVKVLAKIGTEKSLLAFHRAGYSQTPEIAKAGEEGLKEYAARLNLKPEQYLYAALNHYAFDAPAGFLPETKLEKANTRQWTRMAPNRAVKSVFTITVKLVPAGYQVNALAGGQTTEVGPLIFKEMDNQITNILQTKHFAAVDGEYLVDLVLTLDRTDVAAAANMTNAVKTIHTQE